MRSTHAHKAEETPRIRERGSYHEFYLFGALTSVELIRKCYRHKNGFPLTLTLVTVANLSSLEGVYDKVAPKRKKGKEETRRRGYLQ